jgi:putative transposase
MRAKRSKGCSAPCCARSSTRQTGTQHGRCSATRSNGCGRRYQRSPPCSRRPEEDLLAFYAFPPDHWRKLRSTNPLERLNREIGRRTDVVGIFPNDRALIRLATMVVIEQNDEWLVGRRYLSLDSLDSLLEERGEGSTEEALELTAA